LRHGEHGAAAGEAHPLGVDADEVVAELDALQLIAVGELVDGERRQ
jgi:hypothetical protein